MTGRFNEGEVELAHYLGPSAVGAEEVFGADGVGVAGKVVFYGGGDGASGVGLGVVEEGGVEADVPGVVQGMLD